MRYLAFSLLLVVLWSYPATAADILGRPMAEAYLQEGEKALEAQNSAEALFMLRQAAKRDPLNGRAYNLAGLTEVRRGHYEKAETYFRLATASDPRCSGCLYNLATVALRLGNPDVALIAYYRLIIDPDYPTPWLALYGSGLAYLRKRNYDRAIDMFERTLEFVPEGLGGEIRAKIDEATALKEKLR